MTDDVKERVHKLFSNVKSDFSTTDPEFVEIITNFSQGEVVAESKLSEKERMLCILSALLGCQGLGEFKNMLHAALNLGVEPIAIKEVIYQATAYLGIGRTHDFLVSANEIMAEHGIKLPLEPQATVTSETRFKDGLQKQVDLFGQGMADVQTNGPAIRRNVNCWLADNCFGDYYTRGGLNDKEREMITFCFILAQGGCENQLRGHTAGNFGVGNDKEKLYSVIEQCMPYIGYPRTLNAMAIVDEVASKQ
jgi:4-carboxymuconolactone decarboxylase